MQGPDDMVLPEVTFSTFVLSLASSALVQMGEVQTPRRGSWRSIPNWPGTALTC